MRSGNLRTVDLAQAVGVSTQQIREYEAWGVLSPVERLGNGYRSYSERHLDALLTVRALLEAGYQRAETIEIMEAVHRGDIGAALANVDARHAAIHRERQELHDSIEAIRTVMAMADDQLEAANGPELMIGAAAKAVGVRPSALRFWEQEQLVQPGRDTNNRYRTYGDQHLRRLRVIVLLRSLGHSPDTIRRVMHELDEKSAHMSLKATAPLGQVTLASSQACAAATASLWKYIGTWGFTHETSGPGPRGRS